MKSISQLIDKSKQKAEFINRERKFYQTLDFKFDVKNSFYCGFIISPCLPDIGFKSVRYNISYRFRVIYQGRFMNKIQAKKFIDDQFWNLYFWKNLTSKSDSEYFTGGYNYYGELID